ncbi:Serine/threonine-protein kinase PknB [Thalassocella blandensis]|nr:Serine/threonine-protein kinase PknB [Thalassocella blandensis]
MSEAEEISLAKKTQAIFEQALDLPHEERNAFVKTQCGENAEVLAQVNLLLENEESGTKFLKNLYGNENDEGFSLLGQTIDVYRLTEKLGRGGMAEVYLAQRTDGVYENNVAIKVIQSFGHNKTLIARFYRERKILANLKHPNIAQLLDGGSTENGLPYFVMEHVEGERLDTYCKQHKLPIKARLALFLKICSAVTFAHSNLVIHRDLKPANILVDKNGEPKLLDFGIAKLLDQEKEEDVTVTELAMTPHYASPEQLRGEVLTTASDVFSLGVVLYELLTEVRPNRYVFPSPLGYQSETTKTSIPSPSKAVLESKLSKVSAKSHSNILRGDLDTIVLQLLRPEPERRYASVQALTDDIERYLANLPIRARKDSLWYRADRFIRRNAAMIAVVSIALVTLIVSVGYQQNRVIQERDMAIQERNKFKQTQDFLIDLFKNSEPGEARGNTITAREILDKGVQEIQSSLDQQPQTKSELLMTMGNVYQELGLYDVALPLLEQALEIRQSSKLFNPIDVAKGHSELAWSLMETGDYQSAETHLYQAMSLMTSALGEESNEIGTVYHYMGSVQYRIGRFDLAKTYFEKALAITLAGSGPKNESLAAIYGNLGNVYSNLGQLDKEIEYLNKSRMIEQEILGDNHPDIAITYSNLSSAYYRAGDIDKAILYEKKSLAINLKSLSEEHPNTAINYSGLGSLYLEKREMALSMEYHQKSISINKKNFGDDNPYLAFDYLNMSEWYKTDKDYEKALEFSQMALEVINKNNLQEHPITAFAYGGQGSSYDGLGEYALAEKNLLKGLEVFKAIDIADVSISNLYMSLGLVYEHTERYADALLNYEIAYDTRQTMLPEGHFETKEAADKVAQLKQQLKVK